MCVFALAHFIRIKSESEWLLQCWSYVIALSRKRKIIRARPFTRLLVVIWVQISILKQLKPATYSRNTKLFYLCMTIWWVCLFWYIHQLYVCLDASKAKQRAKARGEFEINEMMAICKGDAGKLRTMQLFNYNGVPKCPFVGTRKVL